MFKNITTYAVITAISVAYLGLVAFTMIRDTLTDMDVGPFD